MNINVVFLGSDLIWFTIFYVLIRLTRKLFEYALRNLFVKIFLVSLQKTNLSLKTT